VFEYVDTFPVLLLEAVEEFVFDEFPEFDSVELPLFFTADDPPVAVAEPPVAVLVEFPPVAFDVLAELLED
jgi:hypothetical protein